MADPGTDPPEKRSSDRPGAKRRLRMEMFARLRGMEDPEKSAASEKIHEVIARRPEFQRAAVVAAFVALPSEPDLGRLIGDRLSPRRWCLPRITAEGSIEMREVSGFDDLVIGDFNIREPDPAACQRIPEREIDLILLPGVGFDPVNRARLGRGKGHYDRFLDRLRRLEPTPPAWGICFSGQLTAIEPEAHDQPVDAIVTENGFIS